MARPIWTGSVSFGLVSLPVRLYSATESHTISFHNFRRGTGERVRHKRVAEQSGEDVDYADIVKGYEVRPGEHVMVEKKELDAVQPGRSRAIEIEDFVDLDDVDPVYFQKTYHLVPSDDGAARPYRLLQIALDDAERVGIARFVMRGKQYLAAIRPQDDVLVLETMHFADEVRDPGDLKELDATRGVEVNDRELAAARQLIDSLTTDWDPADYHDTYRAQVLELLERKAEGEAIVAESAQEPSTNVVDLMSALEASIQRARGERTAEPAEASTREPGTASGDGRWTGMTRDELYEEAQRRDIGGRSKMSKDELIDALEEAS
jgi:DNA end-binding protein Ku